MKAHKSTIVGALIGAAATAGSLLLLQATILKPEISADEFEYAIYEAIAVRARSSLETLAFIEAGELDAARERSRAMLKFDEQVLARFAPEDARWPERDLIPRTRQQIAGYWQDSRALETP